MSGRVSVPCVCYNATDMKRPFFSARYLVLLSVIVVFETTSAAAQQSAAPPRAGAGGAYQQGIYLVFPFENAGASPRLDWLGDRLEDVTIQRMCGAGEQRHSHARRPAGAGRRRPPRCSRL